VLVLASNIHLVDSISSPILSAGGALHVPVTEEDNSSWSSLNACDNAPGKMKFQALSG